MKHPMMKYCPECKGGLSIVDSDKQYRYKCDVCETMYEINRFDPEGKSKPTEPSTVAIPDATL